MEAAMNGLHHHLGSPEALDKIPYKLPIPTCCDECSSPHIELMTHEEVYGQTYNEWPFLWVCQECDARCGCHPQTTVPMGTLANAETRMARMRAHNAFDAVWGRKGNSRVLPEGVRIMKRSEAYHWLKKKMFLSEQECHIGLFNKGQCEAVERFVEGHIKGCLKHANRIRDEKAD